MVTERCTTTWRGNIRPMTAINTTPTMSTVRNFLSMFISPAFFLTAAVFFQLSGSTLDIVRQAHLVDQAELLFDEVDVFFFALLDMHQQIARHVVLDAFAVRNGGL